MKKLMFAIILAASSSAFAGFAGENDGDSGPNYVSWCSKENQVITQTPAGDLKVAQDCNQLGKTCQETEVKRPGIHQVYATCN
jgi:hypothetical protein